MRKVAGSLLLGAGERVRMRQGPLGGAVSVGLWFHSYETTLTKESCNMGRVKVVSDYWRVEVSCTETRKVKSRRFVKEGRKM